MIADPENEVAALLWCIATHRQGVGMIADLENEISEANADLGRAIEAIADAQDELRRTQANYPDSRRVHKKKKALCEARALANTLREDVAYLENKRK